MDMYAKCCMLVKAQEVLEGIPFQDVISWSVLISRYVHQGQGEEAISCFERMQIEGFSPDEVTFASIVKACGSMRAIVKGKHIHSDIIHRGLLETNVVLGNALVDMYAGCGFLTEAQNVFEKLPNRDIASWNALIAGCVECGLDQEALMLYRKMQLEGLPPDDVTFVSALRACGNVGFLDMGHAVHADIICKGITHGLYVGNTILDMYANCGALSEAWVTFIKLPNPDVIAWNTIIKGYGMNHDGKMAMQIFKDMKKQGVKPDAITFTCLLTACS